MSSVVGPGTLEQRLRAVRNKRMASRLSRATKLASWIAVLTSIVAVAVVSLLNVH